MIVVDVVEMDGWKESIDGSTYLGRKRRMEEKKKKEKTEKRRRRSRRPGECNHFQFLQELLPVWLVYVCLSVYSTFCILARI